VALVVFLRGVNVGGHKVFRPAALAKQLKHLGAVNIGAAGTFVFGAKVTRAQLRTELTRRLPFVTDIVICEGREIVRLLAHDVFAARPEAPRIVRFVSVLARLPRTSPRLPVHAPSRSQWLVRILVRDGRFVFGEYRRHMQTIRYLGVQDRLFDVPITTRNWNTITAIAKQVDALAG